MHSICAPLFMNVGPYLWHLPFERAFSLTKVTCHWEKGGPAMNWVSAIKYDFAPEWDTNTFNHWNSLSLHNLSFLKHNNDFSWEMQWFLGSRAIDLSCIQSNKSSPTSHPGPICLIQHLSPYWSISLEQIHSIHRAIHWQGIINPMSWIVFKNSHCCYSNN